MSSPSCKSSRFSRSSHVLQTPLIIARHLLTLGYATASGSGKRKRASTLDRHVKQSSTVDLLQPSSRDASGEDAADSAAQSVTSAAKQKKNEASSNKRPRTRSNAADGLASNGTGPRDDTSDAEASDAMVDDGSRSKHKSKSSSSKQRPEVRVEDSKAMPPPVKGGLQDPVGFKTNPPPTGRSVRIYADGVFDLFHLGYTH